MKTSESFFKVPVVEITKSWASKFIWQKAFEYAINA